MAKKTHDIVAVTGSWTDNYGEAKKRYQNVGALMEGDNGPFIMLNRAFNPAGVPFKDGTESILLSCFEPKARDGEQRDQRQAKPAGGNERNWKEELDEEIPF